MKVIELGEFVAFGLGFAMIGVGLFGIAGAALVVCYARDVLHETKKDDCMFVDWFMNRSDKNAADGND